MDEEQTPEEQDSEIIEEQVGSLPGHPGHARAGQQQESAIKTENDEEKKGRFAEKKRKLRDFVKECLRVLKVTKKPSGEEFKSIVKVAGSGILIIGLIGFLIFFAKEGILALF